MKEDEFKAWLEGKGQSQRSIGSRISNIKVLERVWGDIDYCLNDRGANTLLEQLKYSTEDKRHNRPNLSPIEFSDGADIYNGLATLRSALTLYVNFRSAADGAGKYHLSDEIRALHLSLLRKLTAAEIELAMQECDEIGEQEFLTKRNFSSSASTNRAKSKDGSTLYPAKAIVCAAISYLPEGVELDSGSFFNGHGGAHARGTLEVLGFEIVTGERRDNREIMRSAVETAMDAYDQYRATEVHSEIFDAFGDPRDYWVRSTRERENRVYPTKPLIGFTLNKTKLNGGWGEQSDAASRLHNAGFIIVDQNDQPIEQPERYEHLMEGADRIRLCALNYFIEPARENAAREVSIRAGDLAAAIGLKDAFPNICQALGGKKFQKLAQVPPPTSTEPNPSSSTVFTYTLNSQLEADPVTDTKKKPSPSAVNLILYGPPGTGKTYQTAWEAVRLCIGTEAAEELRDDRDALTAKYRRLANEGRIEFLTFHQSLSYEEFVEGLRPSTGDDDSEGPPETENAMGFSLKCHEGIFKRISERARLDPGISGVTQRLDRERSVFKLSMIGDGGRQCFDHSIESKRIYWLFGGKVDWSPDIYSQFDAVLNRWREDYPEATGQHASVGGTWHFKNSIEIGDYVVLTFGKGLVSAVGRATGPYEYRPDLGVPAAENTPHSRTVEWLWHSRDGVERSQIYPKAFSPFQPLYRMDGQIDWDGLDDVVFGDEDWSSAAPKRPFVLIIDEINRANISKVFGELITLLEQDKRLEAQNELRVQLPYSKKRFGVPSNLHIVGTMNTADRSIALLDTALRRRFRFQELMPDPTVLSEDIDGINLRTLLSTINERIEYLFDREHQIGHAYFTGCYSRSDVEDVMRHKVIPLLAEYFYEDWAKVAAVLGDGPGMEKKHFLESVSLQRPKEMPEDDVNGDKLRWSVKADFDFSEFEA